MICQSEKTKAGYVVLNEAERGEVQRAILEEGDLGASKRFGISKFTLMRAALGCEIQVGSAAVIRQGLVGR
jgi:hypothetical protein